VASLDETCSPKRLSSLTHPAELVKPWTTSGTNPEEEHLDGTASARQIGEQGHSSRLWRAVRQSVPQLPLPVGISRPGGGLSRPGSGLSPPGSGFHSPAAARAAQGEPGGDAARADGADAIDAHGLPATT
jgi:hypothetical protein